MDISINMLDSLGVDWWLYMCYGDLQIGNGVLLLLIWGNVNSEVGQVVFVDVQGNLFMLLGVFFIVFIGYDLCNYLLICVSVLVQKGNVNFVVWFKVLILDNNEVVLENFSEFYVWVDGFQDFSFYSVMVGMVVCVMLLIVDDKDGCGVLMFIDIEDGDLSSSVVD